MQLKRTTMKEYINPEAARHLYLTYRHLCGAVIRREKDYTEVIERIVIVPANPDLQWRIFNQYLQSGQDAAVFHQYCYHNYTLMCIIKRISWDGEISYDYRTIENMNDFYGQATFTSRKQIS